MILLDNTVSDLFMQLSNVDTKEILKRTFVYLFASGSKSSTDRNTPADIKDFPINYFSITQVDQLYPGFEVMFPEGRIPRKDEIWGFKRKTVSGSVLNEDKPLNGMPLLGPQLVESNDDADKIKVNFEGEGIELELESSISEPESIADDTVKR